MAVVFPFIGPARRRRAVKRWSDGVLEIFGLELETDGPLPDSADGRPLMLVGNHVSWVDIYAYLSVAEIKFVAKSEVKSWPLIGWFAQNLGTIFVVRDRPRDAVRVGEEMGGALDAGNIVSVFPEGTTTDGSVVMPFSPALLNAAVERAVPVQPVSISYRRQDGAPCRRAAFTGDATLVQSIWQLAGGDRSVVRLSFLEPVETAGIDRRTVARSAEAAVRKSLGHLPAPLAADVPRRRRAPSAATVEQRIPFDALPHVPQDAAQTAT